MTDSYELGYSVDALNDLHEIYSYIENELLVSKKSYCLVKQKYYTQMMYKTPSQVAAQEYSFEMNAHNSSNGFWIVLRIAAFSA